MNQSSLGYRARSLYAPSIETSSLVTFPNFKMQTFASTSIPKPSTSSFTAFYDSLNGNRLSKKDSNGTVTAIESKGVTGFAMGLFQALIGPTNINATHTSVQAAITDGFWRMRIIETFTEPGAISFAALPSNPDILISIDQGITWTTANIITYTGGGNITFTGYGTFRYTVGGTGAISLAANKRVTFDTCNIVNAATVNTCLLVTSTTEVSILNSTITIPDKTDCLINSSVYVNIVNCVFTNGGATTTNVINTTGPTYIIGLYTSTLTCAVGTPFVSISNTSSLVSDVSFSTATSFSFTGCQICNIFVASSASSVFTIINCNSSNINIGSGTFVCTTTASVVSNILCGALTILVASCNLSNISSTGVFTYSAANSKFVNCTLHNGTALTIANTGLFENCSFSGNTTNSANTCKYLDCTFSGTLTVSGTENQFMNLSVVTSITISGQRTSMMAVSPGSGAMSITGANFFIDYVLLTGDINVSTGGSGYIGNPRQLAGANPNVNLSSVANVTVSTYNSGGNVAVAPDSGCSNCTIIGCVLGGGSGNSFNGTNMSWVSCTYLSSNGWSFLGTTNKYVNCKFQNGTSSGTHNEFTNCEFSGTFAVTGANTKVSNCRLTGAVTINAQNTIMHGCTLESTLAIGSTASSSRSVFSNNVITGTATLGSGGGAFVDNTVFTCNNFLSGTPLAIPNAPSANSGALFTGNIISGGANTGVPAAVAANAHVNSTGNSSIA